MTALVTKHLPLVARAPDGIKRLRELILELGVKGHLLSNEFTPDSQIPIGWIKCALGDALTFEYGKALPEKLRSNTGEYPVFGSNGVVGTHNICHVQEPCIVIGRKGSAGALNLNLKSGCCVTDVAYYCIPGPQFLLEYLFILLNTLGLNELGKGIKPGLSRSEVYRLDILIPPLAEQGRIVAKVDELMALCDKLEADQGDAEAAHAQLVQALLESLTQAKDVEDFQDSWRRLSENFHTLFTTEESIDFLKKSVIQLGVMGKLVPQLEADEDAHSLLIRIRDGMKICGTKSTQSKKILTATPEDSDQYFYLPKGWAWTRLASQVIHSSAGWSPNCESRRRVGDEWGVLKVSAVSWDEYRAQENKALPPNLTPRPEHEVRVGDFLVSRANTAELVAKSVVVKETPPGLMLSDKIIRLKLTKLCAPDFINLVNISSTARSYYKNVAGGTSSSMKNVSREQILNLPIPLPPLAEQHRIVAKVDELMALCDRLKANLTDARQQHSQLASVLVQEATA